MEKFDYKLFLKDSLFNIIAGAYISLSGFFLNWVYLNSLGLKNYGTWVVANSYLSVFLVIMSISNQSLFSRLIADNNSYDYEKKSVFSFFVLQLLNILFFGIIWFFTSKFIYNINTNQNANYSIYIFLIAAFNSFSAIPLGFFLGKNNFKKFRFYSSIGVLTLTILAIVCILNKSTDIKSVLNIQLLSAAFVALFSLNFIYQNSKINFDFRIIFTGLKYSFPLFIYTIFSILSDFFIKINLEKDFNSNILGKYNIILLISNLPIIFATAVNSIFIQKILRYNNDLKKIQIVNFTARFILILVFLSSFLLISFQNSFFNFFKLIVSENETSLLYLFLSLNTFIGFCWLLISNELAINKITQGFYFASVFSFLVTYFSYTIFIKYFSIFGAAMSLVLSNFLIFSFVYIYANFKINLIVKLQPLLFLFVIFLFFILTFYLFSKFIFTNHYLFRITYNMVLLILSSIYLYRLKNNYQCIS